jgi:hypothetical protein
MGLSYYFRPEWFFGLFKTLGNFGDDIINYFKLSNTAYLILLPHPNSPVCSKLGHAGLLLGILVAAMG